MKKFNFSRLFAAMIFVAVLVLSGCGKNDAKGTIIGKWVDSYESYNTYTSYDCNIQENFVETSSYGKHNGTVYVVEETDDSGYVYYQFETDITGYDASFKPYTVAAKGKWCAIAYKDLTKSSVKMCDAYKTYDFAASLDDAKKLYTIENGWFAGIDTEFTSAE